MSREREADHATGISLCFSTRISYIYILNLALRLFTFYCGEMTVFDNVHVWVYFGDFTLTNIPQKTEFNLRLGKFTSYGRRLLTLRR